MLILTSMMKSYRNYKKEDWEQFREKVEALKSAVDPHYLLKELGFTDFRETSREIRCRCLIHGGDNDTAFRFNKETRTWVCFSHKCHEDFGNDIIGLIKAMLSMEFNDAVKYLKDMIGDVDVESQYLKSRRDREIKSFIDSYDTVREKPRAVCEGALNKYKQLRSPFFLKQGFKRETLDFFEIGGGWVDKNDTVRDVIPIRDEVGDLVAYSLRDINLNASYDNKYILTPGFNKDSCLYNLHNAQIYAEDLPIIIVEGFKSVWRLHEHGIRNVVAVMGSEITEGQQFLLCTYAFNGVVVMFDNDIAGAEGTDRALKSLSERMTVRPVFIQEVDKDGNGLDPADLTKQQVYEYLETYF